MMNVYHLIPSILQEEEKTAIMDTIHFHEEDLPSPELIQQEIARWMNYMYWRRVEDIERPSTCAETTHKCLITFIDFDIIPTELD